MKKSNVQFSVPVSILKEGNNFIAYSPVLDLSTVGKTFAEAKMMFEEAVQIFFEEIIAKGTINEALSELGWQKKKKTFIPPTVISHITENFSIPITN